MTNNNDLLNGKVYRQVSKDDLSFNIMVRHNLSYDDERLCEVKVVNDCVKINNNGNDPYAGSPTNTLLRLLLPLNDPV